MRILIISQWYSPEPARLVDELAHSLQDLGHSIEVLTGFPNYPSGHVYPGYHLKLWLKEELTGIQITRVPLYPDHGKSAFKRIFNYLSFAFSSSLLGPLLLRRADVIFVYHPPLTVALPAWFISRLWRVPFVYQVQDMWPESLSATEMINNNFFLDLIGRFARWVYARAGAICVSTQGFRENLLSKGVASEKIHVISHWVDSSKFYPEKPNREFGNELGLNDKFNLMYAGNIGKAQGLEAVMEAALLLDDIDIIQFVFVGDGVSADKLQEVARSRGQSNVIFLGWFSEDAMPSLFAHAHILLVHLKDNPLFRITVPHKIFAYMASGKPILAAVSGDAAKIISDEQVGIICEQENPQALASAVRYLYSLTDSELEVMGNRGIEAVHSRYGREELVRRIEKILVAAADNHYCK